ncbi:HET-domain-containing protein [Dothidotthia symphoricarpi CBS 119687]|uniref:HET-domain-containing protein n=1 Tax=Dothidotthia symphoricarpi CBS 119687 TaxID=1392245 RepID=A0A6A6AS72_9PLEO|nr:HET-domain-containing protein [Dothidotthia symphoricarpi CBS 119687]KAF2133381.1 HET-domain-containing protein [Dothidotthia symphoricarpi CBS 119687]
MASVSRLRSCPICLNLEAGRCQVVDANKIFKVAEQDCQGCTVVRKALEPYTRYIENNSTVKMTMYSPTLHICLRRRKNVHEPLIVELEIGDISATPIIASFPALSVNPSPWSCISPSSKISGNTGSNKAVSWARAWIDECLNEHHECYFASSSLLPTRVLRIDGIDDVRLYIPDNEIASYACLSHCWGKEPFITTTTLNLQIHQSGIPWNDLPKTFQDAISFTYRLGLRYLWIDSLCIVQDSVEDWRREGSSMSRIYQDSYVTLAATKSTGASAGCFAASHPKHISRTITIRNSKGEPCDIHGRVPLDHQTTSRPLDERGWAFQESVLSTRMISFLEQEITWECPQRFDCECSRISHELGWSYSYAKHKKNIHVLLSGLEQDRWEEIVTQYTRRSLTFSNDIFPALQGLAKKFQPTMGDYLAGHWRTTLAQSLAWVVDYGKPNCKRPCEWRAPTWSWASVQGKVKWLGSSGKTATATILSAKTVPSGTDPTGQLSSGSLTIRGKYLNGRITYNNKPEHNFSLRDIRVSYASLAFGDAHEELNTHGTEDSEVWWDYTLENEGSDHVANHSAVLVLDVSESEGQYRRNWLILRKLDGRENTYTRIGLLHSKFLSKSWCLEQEYLRRNVDSPVYNPVSPRYSPPFIANNSSQCSPPLIPDNSSQCSPPYSPISSPVPEGKFDYDPNYESDYTDNGPSDMELKMGAMYESATEEIIVTII